MKQLAAKILGPIYPTLVKARRSEAVRDIAVLAGYLPYRRLRQLQGTTFVADVSDRMGMGAVLVQALLCHEYTELHNLSPAIRSTNPLYSQGVNQDFLSVYFERPTSSDLPALIGASYDWAFRKVLPKHISLARANELLTTYFQPKPCLLETLGATLGSRHMFDFSVHFRGTDKFLESGAVMFDPIFHEIDRLLETLGRPGDVFLATDEAEFEVAIRARYPRSTFTSFNIGSVNAGVPRHFSSMMPKDKAIEALTNIYLIASAPICIRTSSLLSSISKIVNPSMETRTVNETLKGSHSFPEQEILISEAQRKGF